MGSEELIANLFRIAQTEAKLKRDNVKGEGEANETHYSIGKIVRNAIVEAGRNNAGKFANSWKKFKTIRKGKKEYLEKIIFGTRIYYLYLEILVIEVINMTSKELLYVEDALEHEKFMKTCSQKTSGQLQDPMLSSYVSELTQKHSELHNKFLNLL